MCTVSVACLFDLPSTCVGNATLRFLHVLYMLFAARSYPNNADEVHAVYKENFEDKQYLQHGVRGACTHA